MSESAEVVTEIGTDKLTDISSIEPFRVPRPPGQMRE